MRTVNSLIGSPIERLEDLRFVRGRGQYVDDLAREGMLHAAVLRSSVAHGHIRSSDTRAALTRPGVHAVITAADIGTASSRFSCLTADIAFLLRADRARLRFIRRPAPVHHRRLCRRGESPDLPC